MNSAGVLSGFHQSPFYQVNPVQTEILYQKAIEFAHLTGKESVIDAYCGIGTIGLIAAGHAKEVVGVELNKDAVKDAILNAKRESDPECEIFQGRCRGVYGGDGSRGK